METSKTIEQEFYGNETKQSEIQNLLSELENTVLINTVFLHYSTTRKMYDVSCGNMTGYGKTVSGAIRTFLKLRKAIISGETKKLEESEVSNDTL